MGEGIVKWGQRLLLGEEKTKNHGSHRINRFISLMSTNLHLDLNPIKYHNINLSLYVFSKAPKCNHNLQVPFKFKHFLNLSIRHGLAITPHFSTDPIEHKVFLVNFQLPKDSFAPLAFFFLSNSINSQVLLFYSDSTSLFQQLRQNRHFSIQFDLIMRQDSSSI